MIINSKTGICAMSECEHECRVVPETQEAECYCRDDFELNADLKHCDGRSSFQLLGWKRKFSWLVLINVLMLQCINSLHFYIHDTSSFSYSSSKRT